MKKSANRLKKEEQVKRLSKEMAKYPVVALFRLDGLPAKYLQKAKHRLRGQAVFILSKKSVLERALSDAGIQKVIEGNSCDAYGVILTSSSPFSIFKELKRSRGRAYAKPGQVAPSDIMIPAGETQFPAGPVLSEFKQAGLDVKIVGGKIHISKDKLLVKEGEVIEGGKAKILQKLDVMPFEIGVEMVSALKGGIIYDREILNVDEQQYLADLTGAFNNARTLAVEASFPAKGCMSLLIIKAHRNARNLAVDREILAKEVIGLILAKAQANAGAIDKVVGG